MRILFASASYAMRYGGPAYSVARLALAVAKLGVEGGLWAPDGTAKEVSLPERSPNLSMLSGSLSDAFRKFGPIDLMHDSGMWLPHNHAIAQLASKRKLPLVVSTRGMLEPWARRHKQSKKWIAWHLYQKRNLRRAQLLHATSEREGENLERLRLGIPIRVLPNGIDVPLLDPRRVGEQTSLKRKALFLGRLAPVKGLDMLIEAWATVRPKNWSLVIAGPDEAEHAKQLREAVARHGLANDVTFAGPVGSDDKSALFQSGSLLVLPSYSESFGMVVAEALAHGLPVLTTTGTPWAMIPETGCGWVVEPRVETLTEVLRQATSVDARTLRDMGEIGRQMIIRRFGWERVGQQFLDIYRELIVAKSGTFDRSSAAAEASR